MAHKPLTYQSRFGTHCTTCGSLVDACGDILQCQIDAKLYIDESIRSGKPLTSYGDSEATEVAHLAETAHRMLGELLFFGPESL